MTVDEIATEALGIEDPGDREAYLQTACGDDKPLRKKVDGLLAALEMADNDRFLASGLFGHENQIAPASTQSGLGQSAEQSGRFELRSKHAIGGLGEVWVAWDRQLGREVALKQMRPEWVTNLDAVARFRREAEITGYLEHPGVVPIYSLGDQDDGRPFYAMQFIRGRTLQEVVEEQFGVVQGDEQAAETRRPSSWYESALLRKMLDHFVDVCQTIDYAHSKRVVHRDLKPANIMLGTYGQTLVVDWGLAKWLDRQGGIDEFGTVDDQVDQQLDTSLSLVSQNDSSVDETRQGTTLGTPRFMSPEQAAGKIDQIGPAADVYCLGATLYYILAGQAPHRGESDLRSTFQRIVEGRFDPPAKIRSEIPRPLQAIVLKSMATEMHQRYDTAGSLAEDVQRYLADQPVTVFSDPPIERMLRWARNHRAVTAAMAVALLLTFIGSISGLLVRQEMNRRDMEAARIETEKEREIQFQAETRRLEAVAASQAAIERSDAALRESRYADAAALIGVAIDRMKSQQTLTVQRESLIEKQQRLQRLGMFDSLHRAGEDFDHLAQDSEAIVMFQASLDELGVWDSETWWNELPADDLSALQRDRLRWQVYRVFSALNSLYVTKMVALMGSDSQGGTPSALKMFRSYLSTNIGKREAQASVQLSKRIEMFRPAEASRWLGSIASFRLSQGKRVEPINLGPPHNAPDGQLLAIYSLIASVDPAYRSWFGDYGETFLVKSTDDPAVRSLNVAIETLRRVSDEAADDYWIRLTLSQSYFLVAQNAEANGNLERAIEHYELARSEYGRCIAIRPNAAFGFADRSTVALRQAELMRNHPGFDDGQRQRAAALLQTSFRDASQARRLTPKSHWVYWHVGATAAALGQADTATEAFFTAVEYGFDVQDTMDAPFVRLDDLRGRKQAIEFAYRDSDMIMQRQEIDPVASRKASLIASLEYSRGNLEPAITWSSKAIALNPDNQRAHQIAGWCEFRGQSWDKAMQHFQAAIRLSPDDAVSLIGAARVAEQEDNQDLEQSDRWYRRAIDAAASARHRSTAWFGLAKHELRRGEFDKALAAIESARALDKACDVSQFNEVSRSEARRLLTPPFSSPEEEKAAVDQVKKLKEFVDQIATLPTASVNQIVDSASGRPPRELPLLGADFELPLETYWQLVPQSDADETTGKVLGGSPPLSITGGGYQDSSCLTIRRAESDRATTAWTLSQMIPATTGQTYRATALVRSIDSDQATSILAIRYSSEELARLDLSGETDTWTRRSVEFSLPSSDEPIDALEIRIEIADPQSGAVMLDDISVTLVQN